MFSPSVRNAMVMICASRFCHSGALAVCFRGLVTLASVMGAEYAWCVEAPSVSGFGSAAITHVSAPSDSAYAYRRDDQLSGAANNTFDAGVDSNVGLQLDWAASDLISVGTQVLARRRDHKDADVKMEWGGVRISPTASTKLRIGKLAAPTYMVSESRWVGYAHNWMHPPQEVYGLTLLQHVNGADFRWDGLLGDGQTLAVSAIAGNSRTKGVVSARSVRRVMGLTAAWAPAPEWLIHAGSSTGQIPLPGGATDLYRFHGVGVSWDSPRWFMQTEVVARRSERYLDLVDANGWYVMVGRHFDAWTPFLIQARTASRRGLVSLTGMQSTTSVGVRVNMSSVCALKLQVDRIDLHGTQGVSMSEVPTPSAGGANSGAPGMSTSGTPTRPLVVIGASVDFWF